MTTLRFATNVPHRGKMTEYAQGLLRLKGAKECRLDICQSGSAVLEIKGEEPKEQEIQEVVRRAGFWADLL